MNPIRSSRYALPMVGAIAFAGAVVLTTGRRRFDRDIQHWIEDLLAAAATDQAALAERDLESLPLPVRRYLDAVLEDRQTPIRTVGLRQRGSLRLGGAESAWRPFEATQRVTTRPPGFVWDARVGIAPLVQARVLDMYAAGEGRLRARLLSAIPVASAGPSPEINRGELLRYLAEAVWYPTALLPGQGLTWSAIDARSARATLEHHGAIVSAVFHFTDDFEIDRVTADRYRTSDDSIVPWTGHFRDYQVRNGIRVPGWGAVEWNLPDGDLRYWRAHLTSIDHRP